MPPRSKDLTDDQLDTPQRMRRQGGYDETKIAHLELLLDAVKLIDRAYFEVKVPAGEPKPDHEGIIYRAWTTVRLACRDYLEREITPLVAARQAETAGKEPATAIRDIMVHGVKVVSRTNLEKLAIGEVAASLNGVNAAAVMEIIGNSGEPAQYSVGLKPSYVDKINAAELAAILAELFKAHTGGYETIYLFDGPTTSGKLILSLDDAGEITEPEGQLFDAQREG